jgi:hypothetical protein
MLGLEPRTSHRLSKCCTTEPHHQLPNFLTLIIYFQSLIKYFLNRSCIETSSSELSQGTVLTRMGSAIKYISSPKRKSLGPLGTESCHCKPVITRIRHTCVDNEHFVGVGVHWGTFTTWATPPALFCDGSFETGSWEQFVWHWLRITILLISASWVARITGVSHCYLTTMSKFKVKFLSSTDESPPSEI